MFRKICVLLLCAVLLVAALPVHTFAATDEEVQRICDQIRDVYWKTYSAVGELKGYCGAMAGWELYYLGITDYAITQNGNQMYNVLSKSTHINEGFTPQLYPATSYTIEEALNAITSGGAMDAYNIMVGFHSTDTEAGKLYGHVTVIHAVLDGIVYFTEGFATPFNSSPSQPMICSIQEFAEYYDSWTRFEGMIHFGSDKYVDGCTMYNCNQYVAANEELTLLSVPAPEEAEQLRTVAQGERLHAVGLCMNEQGEMFYQIQDGSQLCYAYEEQVEPVVFVYSDLILSELTLPTQLQKGENFRLSGVVRSEYNMIYNLVVQVEDEHGVPAMTFELVKTGSMVDLSAKNVNNKINISFLPEGRYTYNVYCDMVNHYNYQGNVIGEIQRVLAASSEFTVGDVEPVVAPRTVQEPEQAEKEGWQYEDGCWYYYENNAPRTGWFCDNGVDYYLQEDGSAATGWKQINGKNRYFTETGAMRTGWVECQRGRFYMLSNGVAALGWKEIDGVLYYFNPFGRMLTDTVMPLDGKPYQIDSNGVAFPLQ